MFSSLVRGKVDITFDSKGLQDCKCHLPPSRRDDFVLHTLLLNDRACLGPSRSTQNDAEQACHSQPIGTIHEKNPRHAVITLGIVTETAPLCTTAIVFHVNISLSPKHS